MSSCKEIYLREFADHDLLSREEEVELFKTLEVCSDEQAKEIKEKLVKCNQRLVIKKAFSLIKRGLDLPFMDLVQDGNIGLLKAIDRYKFWYGYKFSTYAWWWIAQSIQRGIQSKMETIRTPTHWQDLNQKRREFADQYMVEHGEMPDDEWMAEQLDQTPIKMKVTEDTLSHIDLSVRSLDSPVKDGDSILEDYIEDDRGDPESEFERQKLKEAVKGWLSILSDREREILELRYGLKDDHQRTLKEVGLLYNISRERVRQLERKACCKIVREAKHTNTYRQVCKMLESN